MEHDQADGPSLHAPKTRILAEGRNCWRVAHADRVAFIVDAADYFSAFAAALKKAKQTVLIAAWDIDSRIHLFRDDSDRRLPVRLGEFLNALAAGSESLNIHILDWDFAVIYALERELFPLYKFNRKMHGRVHFQLDSKHPVGASHHQKIVVVDDALAFVGGMDLAKERWDTPEHLAEDPRRVNPSGKPYPPHHDVQMAVDGAAAESLGALFRRRWQRVRPESIPASSAAGHDPWPEHLRPHLEDVFVGIARTDPTPGEGVVREVERLYVDAIHAAKNHIYIENQYLTSTSVEKALSERLQEEQGPEVVMVLPRRCSGWLEESTMGTLRARLLGRLKEKDLHGRLGAYFPMVPGLGSQHLNVHSKVMVVDDTFVRVGSSNLNNRSMGVDSECDLALESDDRERIQKAIARFRWQLISEHLDVAPEEVARQVHSTRSLLAAVEHLRGSDRTLVPLSPENQLPLNELLPETPSFDPDEPIDPDRILEQFLPGGNGTPSKVRLWRFLAALFAMGGLAAAWRWTPLHDWLALENITAAAEYLRGEPLAPLIVLSIFLIGSLVLFPVTVIILGTALVFSPLSTLLYSVLGCSLGAAITYGLGQLLGRDVVSRLAGAKINRISRRMGRHGIIAVTAVRLVPVAPFTIVNMVAGASHIRFWDFVLGTALGVSPGIVAITLFEHQLEAVIQNPGTKSLAVLAGLVAVLAAAALGIRKWLGSKTESGRNDAGDADGPS